MVIINDDFFEEVKKYGSKSDGRKIGIYSDCKIKFCSICNNLLDQKGKCWICENENNKS